MFIESKDKTYRNFVDLRYFVTPLSIFIERSKFGIGAVLDTYFINIGLRDSRE